LGALLFLTAPAAVIAADLPERQSFQPVFQRASLAKGQAILGAPSKLQAMAAQQAGLSAAVAVVEAIQPEPAVSLFRSRSGEGTSGRPDVFGSTALSVAHTPLDAKWQRVQSALAVPASAQRALSVASAADDRAARVEAVNSWVNRQITFTDDNRAYGAPDRWATASETLSRGRGDCEDYAIAKMQMLRALGFAAEDLYLTVVKDLVRRADHAVLLVRVDDRMLVLDNNTDVVLESQQVADYRPVFTYAASGSWVHGYQRPMQFADLSTSGSPRAAR
jgi:predicted transglutaminase-like cysteine proteinase